MSPCRFRTRPTCLEGLMPPLFEGVHETGEPIVRRMSSRCWAPGTRSPSLEAQACEGPATPRLLRRVPVPVVGDTPVPPRSSAQATASLPRKTRQAPLTP